MTQIATRTPEIVSTSPFNSNEWEAAAISYERSDDMHIDMCVMRPEGKHPAELLIGVMAMDVYNPDRLPVEQHNCVLVPETTSDEECMAMFKEHLALSIAEARILRDLLNRPDVQAILDAQK